MEYHLSLMKDSQQVVQMFENILNDKKSKVVGTTQHKWDSPTHVFRSGKGQNQDLWDCMNPECKEYKQNQIYDILKAKPPCTRKCKNCGDASFNAREICPLSSKIVQIYDLSLPFQYGETTMLSWHGQRLRAIPVFDFVNTTYNNQGWQQWKFIRIGEDKYVWISYFNNYLRGRDNYRVDLAKRPWTWEVWTKIPCGNRNFWKSFHGTYLGAKPDGYVYLTGNMGQWQQWSH